MAWEKTGKFVLLGLMVLAGLLLGACSQGNSSTADSNGWPKKVVFAYYVDDEVPGLRYDATSSLAKYLSEEVGIPFSLKKSASYGPIIEALRARKADISMLGTFSYILAVEKAGAEIIVSRKEDDGPVSYHSLIFARADRGIEDFEDLKNRSKEFSLAFTNPASTSGHLIPRSFLETEGLKAEKDFRELVFPGKHNATILSVLSGQIDVGCISQNTLNKLIILDRVDPTEVKVLWKSPAIPSGCIVVRNGFPLDLKTRIQEAIVDMRVKAPEAWENVKQIYRYSSSPDGYFYASNGSEYEPVRKLADKLNQVEWKN